MKRISGTGRRGTRLFGAGVLALAALGTATLAGAQAPQSPAGPGPERHHGGPPPHMGGAGPMMLFAGPPAMIGRSVDRLLDGLGATDAQRTQIRQIALAAATDLRAQREAERGLRERGLQIFSAPSVDANAAEALRQQLSQQRDQASRRVLQAMLDVANVLTPEQRATIGYRIRDRGAVMHDRLERMQREHQERPGRPMPPAAPSAPPVPAK